MDILNLQKRNEDFFENTSYDQPIKNKTQQRNGRKYWTMIFGLNKEQINITKLCKQLKKTFNCSVSKQQNDKEGFFLQMQGEHKKELIIFLKKNYDIDVST